MREALLSLGIPGVSMAGRSHRAWKEESSGVRVGGLGLTRDPEMLSNYLPE